MLPATHRLRDAAQFRGVMRSRGSGRAGGSLLVVHLIDTDAAGLSSPERQGPRVGFVVSKAVGNAVVRSRTKRVLRHVVRGELATIDPRLDIVVRTNPAIAGSSTSEIRAEFVKMLDKAQRRMPGDARVAPSVSRETRER